MHSAILLLRSCQRIRTHRLLTRLVITTTTTSPFSIMSSAKASTMVGVVQMTSTPDKEKTYKQAEGFIEQATERGAKVVFLPECFDHVMENKENIVEQSETIQGPTITRYKQLAARLGVWLSLGGFHERLPDDDQRIMNSHIMIDSAGEIRAKYSKIHLFSVDMKGGIRLQESDTTIPGSSIIPPVDTPAGKVGLSICYDVRFPELSTALTQQGAEILTYPSAFTIPTGMAHWEVLLRSRAIENQTYVIAAAQIGQHTAKRASYGHSMIVDPWGTVIAECSAQPGFCVAEIDLAYLERRRIEMPVMAHRRYDLYGHINVQAQVAISSAESYAFGEHRVPASCVFYRTPLSYAIVNRKPVLPGHVLVCPVRVVESYSEMTAAEIADLFSCVQRVTKVIREQYGGTSATMAMQDGKDAGQTVKHVHVHILPRKPGDFTNNDDIYDKLEKHDAAEAGNKWRSEEDMAAEAANLRQHFL